MSRIKIKNFGPLKETASVTDGWIDIKKVTVFTGNQGSGKSTVAKLVSTFTWMEKVLTRGDFKEKEFTAAKFKNKYCGYHRISNYFIKEQTEIFYEGDSYKFTYTKQGELVIEKNENALDSYALPQIMYVPAERNFISMVNKPDLIKDLPDALLGFLTEYDKAKQRIKSSLELPINHAQLEYNKQNNIVYVKGEDYKVKLMEASSGFQSIVPLYLVSLHLSESVKSQANSAQKMSSDEAKRFEAEVANIWNTPNLTDEQRRIALSAVSARFNKSAFVNIVEEPEQNLYPESQWMIMKQLLAFNNALETNRLVVTTHSPYLINSLTVAVKAGMLLAVGNLSCEVQERINAIYPIEAAIHPDEIAIYEFNEIEGTVTVLDTYHGLPSDENFLNRMLERTNEDFADLLEIQQEL
ncbi:AAA family ATPase [Phocaeicola dorei]|jgi:predicted ATPase|uniref:AAA family ATPase n=1 Tax=Bacteroidaceae TaxID=815 RepID=UPI0022E122D8|nr:AAA family ATPase [Bacteroides uniformis]